MSGMGKKFPRFTAGNFRHMVLFQNPNKAYTGSGGQTEAYTTVFRTRGLFVQESSSARFMNGANYLVDNYSFYCYWRSTLDAVLTIDTRLVYDGNEYRIVGTQRYDERRQYYKFSLVMVQ